MSVFGESYCKMKSLVKTPGVVISLQYSILFPTWADPNLIMHQSILTGVKNFTKVSEDLARFNVILNIFKNGTPATIMGNILAYNHDEVNFMPHQDTNIYVQAYSGGAASFYITEMKPFYWTDDPPVLYDRLSITFEAMEPIKASDSLYGS